MASTEIMVSDRIERPWALMRHHAGWADVFHIDSETSDSITGFYPDRESVGPPVTYSLRAVLARYLTIEAARASTPSFGAVIGPVALIGSSTCASRNFLL